MISRALRSSRLGFFSTPLRAQFSGADIREKFSHEITEEGYDY